MSRPVESVPNQCPADGLMYRIVKFVAPTSCVAIHGAKIATTTKITTITVPMMPNRFIKQIGHRGKDALGSEREKGQAEIADLALASLVFLSGLWLCGDHDTLMRGSSQP